MSEIKLPNPEESLWFLRKDDHEKSEIRTHVRAAIELDRASRPADPTCACGAAVLYECPACSASNYPASRPTGEAVFQMAAMNGAWVDVSRADYERPHHEDIARRIVYTAPPAVSEDVRELVLAARLSFGFFSSYSCMSEIAQGEKEIEKDEVLDQLRDAYIKFDEVV